MSQSSFIAGVLLVGFLIYITGKGQLPDYLAVVGL